MKRILKSAILLVFILSITTPVYAGSISVSPLFIDYTTEARDIKEEKIKIKNNTDSPVRMFASVNEITLGGDGEIKEFVPPSMTDRRTSVTSWIEITRGRNEIPPGGEIEVPFTIRINPNAAPGKYNAFIGFANAQNRDKAEAKIMAGEGDGVVLRIFIDEKQDEFMKLVSFVTSRFNLGKGSETISYELENTGDVPLTPKGDIIFYNSKGEELTSIELNTKSEKILPGETTVFTELIPNLDRIGKNKAFLTLEYGDKNKAAVYDTIFFYSTPVSFIIVVLMLLMASLLFVTVLIYKATRPAHTHIDDIQDVSLYVREKHYDHDEKDHDLNLKTKSDD